MKSELARKQTEDLNYIRKVTRKVMETLMDDSIDFGEKKSMLSMFNTVNNSAKIMCQSIATSIVLDKYQAMSIETKANAIENKPIEPIEKNEK